MNLIVLAIVALGAIGLISAVLLYFTSRKFAVQEDERIGQVSAVLPQANCGGCGYPGCSGFAGACVKAADKGSLEGLLCPVGGQPVSMENIKATCKSSHKSCFARPQRSKHSYNLSA